MTEEIIQKAVSLTKTYGARRVILFGTGPEHSERAQGPDLFCEVVPDW